MPPSAPNTPGAPGGGTGNAELAYEQIRRAIVEGRYRPGQRLVEQRLGEELDLSRTPVREALRQLEVEGLVTTERHRGATVRTVTETDILDLYELRARLESLAAEQAAARATAAHHAALAATAAAFDEAVAHAASAHASRAGAGPDAPALEVVRAMSAANGDFHETVVAAASHPRLARILARTVDVPLVFQAFRKFDQGQASCSALFHHLIADAVAAGDGPRAARLMTEHILQGRDVLLASLEDLDSVDELFR